MSTIIFKSTQMPDKRLIKEHQYIAYLSPDQKKEIVDQLKEKIPNLDNYIVEMHVDISAKLYDR